MKKRPSLVLREPVKLYDPKVEKKEQEIIPEPKKEEKIIEVEKIPEVPKVELQLVESRQITAKQKKENVVFPPRIQQIWDYFCKKAKSDETINRSFNLTRAEVMKEAGIGSTNTYRDALKRFQELGLLEIELRPGVNSGSIFTFTDKVIEQVD